MSWLRLTKFRRTNDYDMDQLLRDLIEMAEQIEKRIKAIEDRLDAGGL